MYILEVGRTYPDKGDPDSAIFERDQAHALREWGHKVVFAALDLRSIRRWRHWGIQRFEDNGMTVYRADAPVGPLPMRLFTVAGERVFSRLMERLIREDGKPEVVHVHFGDLGGCVVRVCEKYAIPCVVTEHSSAVNIPYMKPSLRTAYREIYTHAAAVVAVSAALAERIEAHTGVCASVIPNIIDLSLFPCCARRTDGGAFRFVSAGNLERGKGFDLLLHAFAALRDEGIDASLLIMGGGTEEEALHTLAVSLGLAEAVRFTGTYRRPDFARALSESDAFVLASRGETFGVVYAEAMACGRPVIATRCGGPDGFVNEQNGLLVSVDDVEALTEAMRDMAEHVDRYDPTAIAAEAKAHFSAASVAGQLTALFARVVKENMK